MKHLLLLVLVLFPFICPAQSIPKFGRTHSDSLPENFKLSTAKLRQHVYNGIPAKVKDELFPRASYTFADQSAVQMSSLFASGQVYSDWPALEEYVNQIVQKIMPEELAKDSVIHAYILKDGATNAFMTPTGILCVNIGLLDDVPTEAALAGVLAHELAHYYLRHSLYTFVKNERGDFNRILYRSSESAFSIQNETQADSMAIVWMNRSGYGLKGMRDGFLALYRVQHRAIMQSPTYWEIPETTHPGSERRLAMVDSMYNKTEQHPGADFIVSQKKFYKFKEAAKSEILSHLLHDFAYDLCIEKAFKYHILNPDKAEYVYYLMEGIRRKCYLNTDYWDNKFITSLYYKEGHTSQGRRKEIYADHIFKGIPGDILCMTDLDVNNIRATFYWEGQVKFETYEEAFHFFAQVGELLKEPECVFSKALYTTGNATQRNELLKTYLGFENIQFKDLATSMLNGDVYKDLPDKALTVMSDFYPLVRQGKEEILIRTSKQEEQQNLNPLMQAAIAEFPRRHFLNMSDLQNYQVNDYVMFTSLKKFSLLTIHAKGERTELHILDPQFWQLLHKYGVSDFEFIDFIFYDARKYDNTLESYKEIIGTSLSDLLDMTKHNRYLQARVTSVREAKVGLMKMEYYGEDEKVDFNKPAREAVTQYINLNLKIRDKQLKKLDDQY